LLPDKDDNSDATRRSPAAATTVSPPVQARLVAGGISVTYRVPAPPLITAADVPILHYDHEEEDEEEPDGYSGRDAELDEFLAKVKSASPLLTARRSDTSSASLPVSPWQSSRDSLLLAAHSPDVGGNDSSEEEGSDNGGGGASASLNSEDFEPQIMTEDCVVVVTCSSTTAQPYYRTSSGSTTSSGSSPGGLVYASYIPDREVNIVENEFTRLQPLSVGFPLVEEDFGSSDVLDGDEDNISLESDTRPLNEEHEYSSSQYDNNNPKYLRAWHSSSTKNNSITDIKAFWAAHAGQLLVKASSESNMFERGHHPPENGLREIPKDREYTSCEEEEEEEDDDEDDGDYPVVFHSAEKEEQRHHHTHAGPQLQAEESGFYSYSYDNVIPEEPSDYEDSWTSGGTTTTPWHHINLIAVGGNDDDDHDDVSDSVSLLTDIDETKEDEEAADGTNDHVTIITVEHTQPLVNITHTAALVPVTATNTTNHRQVSHQHGAANNGTSADPYCGDELEPPSSLPPFRCSVKDLRRMFERQAAAVGAVATAPSGRSRSSIPDGMVNEICYVVHSRIIPP
jgi:hypothetical protein